MLTISAAQMRVFADAQRRSFARRLAERAISQQPNSSSDRDIDALATQIDPEIGRAHACGMRSRRMLERWTDVAMAVGFGFSDTCPWAIRTLARRDLSPRRKLERIEAASVFAARAGGMR